MSLHLNPETLCGIDAFRYLDLASRRALAEQCRSRHYGEGEAIIKANDTSREVYFMVSGRARAVNHSAEGHQVALQDITAGQMFGELGAIDDLPRSATVLTTAECYVVMLSAEAFRDVRRRWPAVAECTLAHLSRMVRLLTLQVYERDVLPVSQRVRSTLLRLAAPTSDGRRAVITPAPTHQELAAYIGTTRESVSREMAVLKRAGLLNRRGNDLLIMGLDTPERWRKNGKR